jgi:acetylornithine deacetylase/succinyl-diaminopimelate desuccinylase-like protein
MRFKRFFCIYVLFLLAAGCTHQHRELGPSPDLRGWPEKVDWGAAGDEAVRLLSGYLQVNTANPPGNETAGAAYLGRILDGAQIPYEIMEFAPGRGSLIARLKGDGRQPPLCLLSHTDVAEAREADWPEGRGPWSGKVDADGMIWGRGALDMKGMGLLETLVVVWLKRLGVPLTRDVVLLAVADEEDGNRGMRQLIQYRWAELGCSHLLNEGGIGLKDAIFEGQTSYAVSVAEKGFAWVRLTARGKPGHGSTPRDDTAVARLLDALQKLRQDEPDPRYHPSIEELLARVGEAGGGLKGSVLMRPVLVRWLAEGQLTAQPAVRAALIDTVNVTGLSTDSQAPNVVPGVASATLDCRLLPGTTPQALVRHLQQVVGAADAVSFELTHSSPAYVSEWEGDPLFEALMRRAVEGQEDAVAGPVLSVGFSDSNYARALGVRAYGLVPFVVTQEEAETMHGVGERVSSSNVKRGLQVLLKVVLEVASDSRVRP